MSDSGRPTKSKEDMDRSDALEKYDVKEKDDVKQDIFLDRSDDLEPLEDDVEQKECIRDDVEQEDIFMRAVEVANAAAKAQELADRAVDMANCIEVLAEQARIKADMVVGVARGVTATATSVAMMALQLSQQSSYEQAFHDNPDYECVMNLDHFLQIITPTPAKKNTSHMKNPLTVCDSSPGDMSFTSGGSVPRIFGNNLIVQESYVGTMTSPVVPLLKAGSRRNSLDSQILAKRSDSFKREQLSTKSLASSVPEEPERFPQEIRSPCSTVHDSTMAMTPLWEDRYLPGGEIMNKKPSTELKQVPLPHTWEEKKQFKQFQMKLQKVKTESSGSVKMTEEDIKKSMEGLQTTSNIPAVQEI